MIRMVLYNSILMMLFPVFLLWFLFQRLVNGKFQRGFTERFAWIDFSKESGKKNEVVWCHAASVGEVLAAEPILSLFHSRHPDVSLLLTTNTDTGYAISREKLPFLDNLYQAPFDLHPIISRFIRIVNPAAIVIMETELWPGLIVSAARLHIPIMVANGRISDRSMPRYSRLSWFLGPILQKVSLFAMQSGRDAERITRIGAKPESVVIAGNVKFDRKIMMTDQSDLRSVLDRIGWRDPAGIVIAGSTHEEEESVVLEAFLKVKASRPEAKLLLAPRHLNRLPDVITCISRYHFSYKLRSDPDKTIHSETSQTGTADIMVLDVMGELAAAYALGSVSFVGGSLRNIGGHNVLEPAAMAKPVLFGPYTMNFRDPVEQLLADDAAYCVRDAAELADAIIRLMQNPDEAVAMGRRGAETVRRNQGAVLRHVEYLEHILAAGSHLEFLDRESVVPKESGNG